MPDNDTKQPTADPEPAQNDDRAERLKVDPPAPSVPAAPSAPPTTRWIKLSAIQRDLQLRERTDPAVVDDYAEAMRAGAVFPLPVVFDTASGLLLVDGHHTVGGIEQLAVEHGDEDPASECRVIPGTRLDALLYAAGANRSHGLRRSNSDKRRAVTAVLGEEACAEWSNGKIAEVCGVSHTFVAEVRRDVAPAAPTTRVGADGRRRAVRRPARTSPVRVEAATTAPATRNECELEEQPTAATATRNGCDLASEAAEPSAPEEASAEAIEDKTATVGEPPPAEATAAVGNRGVTAEASTGEAIRALLRARHDLWLKVTALVPHAPTGRVLTQLQETEAQLAFGTTDDDATTSQAAEALVAIDSQCLRLERIVAACQAAGAAGGAEAVEGIEARAENMLADGATNEEVDALEQELAAATPAPAPARHDPLGYGTMARGRGRGRRG